MVDRIAATAKLVRSETAKTPTVPIKIQVQTDILLLSASTPARQSVRRMFLVYGHT